MQHFIAFIWNREDFAACNVASDFQARLSSDALGWRCAMSSNGMAVLIRSDRAGDLQSLTLPHSAGVVVGILFPKGTDRARVTQLDARATSQIVNTHGRILVDEYWGNYVAIIQDEATASALVIRDCSGKLPCFKTSAGPVSIIFSYVGDLASLHLPRRSLNLDYLAAFILDPDLQTRHCALEDMQEILAGECLTISRGVIVQFPIWNPAVVAKHDI